MKSCGRANTPGTESIEARIAIRLIKCSYRPALPAKRIDDYLCVCVCVCDITCACVCACAWSVLSRNSHGSSRFFLEGERPPALVLIICLVDLVRVKCADVIVTTFSPSGILFSLRSWRSVHGRPTRWEKLGRKRVLFDYVWFVALRDWFQLGGGGANDLNNFNWLYRLISSF